MTTHCLQEWDCKCEIGMKIDESGGLMGMLRILLKFYLQNILTALNFWNIINLSINTKLGKSLQLKETH